MTQILVIIGGDVIGIDFIESLFGLPNNEQKQYLKEYVEEKFNLKFDTDRYVINLM